MEMRFYWVQDQVDQNQFIIYWRKGEENLADYFTKHHPPSHHRVMRSTYLHPSEGTPTLPQDTKEDNSIMDTSCEGVLMRLSGSNHYMAGCGIMEGIWNRAKTGIPNTIPSKQPTVLQR